MSYILTNSQVYNSIVQPADRSSIESSYTWSVLIQGTYQFSVVAFTSVGPGDADSVMVSISSSKLILF